MNAPLIWIVFPLLVALVTGAVVRRQGLTRTVAVLACALLALLARILPLDTAIRLGPLSLKIEPSLAVLGRSFTLEPGQMVLVALIFFIAGLWFLGGGAARVNPWFVPFGLTVVALLVAALAVEPFLYAALIIEMAVLLCVPLLSPPTERLTPGVVRFAIFQTLAMPFILFTGWMLTGVETSPSDSALAARATVFLGLGFAFLLAVFPFYSWIPMLGEQAHPYAASFVFALLPMTALMFGLDFIDRYAWLREEANLYTALRLVGVLMVATGGIWAAFQRHAGRIMGYAAILQTGLALVAVGEAGQGGMQLFAAFLLPRAVILWVWALALAILRERCGSLWLERLNGVLQSYPLAGAGVLLALFSAAGIPLLAGYPLWLNLFTGVASASLPSAAWLFVGSAGMVFAGFRALTTFASVDGQLPWHIGERAADGVLLGLGMAALLLLGLLPHAVLPMMLSLLQGFTHLGP